VGVSHAPVQGIGRDLVGVGAEASGVSVMKLPSGRWRAQVYDPLTGGNVSVSRVLGGPGTFGTKSEGQAGAGAPVRASLPRGDPPCLLVALDERSTVCAAEGVHEHPQP
jgi:hypothetical protein